MKFLSSLSDGELVKLVREEDQELYAVLVKRYQDKLLRYAQRILRDEDVAIDIVQEAFIKAFKNLNGFNINKKFSSWIYRIAHNLCIDHIRKNKKQISLEENEWVKNTISNGEDIEAEFDKKEIKKKVDKVLEKLPVKYRSVLTLYYIEEKTYEEISDVLRVSKGTVATWLSRGKKLMKKVYEK
ncbi:MAG: sigma-70 family RNA polymerase sigma factor [Patescibacteria group bacterium]